MRKFLRAALTLSFAAACTHGVAGEWLSGRQGDREYRLYLPAGKEAGASPLVVMLHGCTQGPEAFAESTRMNAQADEGKFIVLYPAQKITANPMRCWNWFLPRNQTRGSGEPAEIVAMVDQVAKEHAVDRKRVYVAGLSAGASMSAILAACYPDVFAAAAIHDGTMYKSATTLVGAQKVMKTAKTPDPDALGDQAWACGGKRRLSVPVAVWHGQGDNVVNRDNAEHIVRQFIRLNDLADDGKTNGSSPSRPVTQSAQTEGGYAYTVTRYGAEARPLIEYYRVEKMGHAWSGGKDDLLFSDAKGPDASRLMWGFFKQHRR